MFINADITTKTVSETMARLHNYPEEDRRQLLMERMGDLFDEAYAKVPGYLAGAYLADKAHPQGWFNTMSLGNWLTIAEAAGVKAVPARLAGVMNPVACFQMSTGGDVDQLSAQDQESLFALVNNLATMKRSEMLRFDPSGSASLKIAMADDGVPNEDCRGVVTPQPGVNLPEFRDPRLADNFLSYTDAVLPIWVRPWVKAMRMASGDIVDGRADRRAAKAAATRPVEWRIYIRDSKIVAASLYYAHAAITIEEARGLGLDAALTAARTCLDWMIAHGRVPHHPQYEFRDNLDTALIHCSLDFLITPEGAALLLEGGPAHLRNPNWGAHPCSFGVDREPDGIALGGGRFAPMPEAGDQARGGAPRESC